MADRYPEKLYFLRHGVAADADSWRGDDFDRPLTDEGRERMALEAEAIKRLGLGLDRIVTSPLVRARQTAEIVAGALGIGNALVEDERLGPGFGLERLADVLQAHRGAKALMLVGHEPTLSATVGRLIGGAALDFKKGAVARVDLSDGSRLRGVLIWLAPPKVLLAGFRR
ncbi:MAG: phosphohistidine phosphatase, SixA [Candidatus Eremiobacteraeota bacterium]|jgi:phosphohistidine phosphatase|nr:phosphohistidine phosphatase, SixA [Candidatus Eremiobacteraeota bacterium]